MTGYSLRGRRIPERYAQHVVIVSVAFDFSDGVGDLPVPEDDIEGCRNFRFEKWLWIVPLEAGRVSAKKTGPSG